MQTRREWLKNVAWTAGVVGLALPDSLTAQTKARLGKKVALLIGVDIYVKPGFPPLTCCERDVRSVQQALQKLGFDSIEVLLGSAEGAGRATKQNIEQTLNRLAKDLGQSDLILVMLSGHGQQFSHGGKTQEDAFFCPVDAVNRDATTLVSLSYVTDEVLANNVGKRLVLVDACRDAPKDPKKGAKGIQGRQITLAEDTAVFFSCRAGQQSYTNDELNHSLFTYCVLEALQGQGATDGDVTWDGIVNHVKNRMAKADMQQRVPEGSLQSPISAGSVDRTVLGRLRDTPVAASPSVSPQPGTPALGPSNYAGTRAGEERDDNGLEMKLVWCPPGEFTMGSPESEQGRGEYYEDQVQVSLTSGFWLGKHEVTQEVWKRVMGTTPWKEECEVKQGPRYPATCISWDNAMEFALQLTDREREAGRLPSGWTYTLPTEAQWEYACRAGTQTSYSFGNKAARLREYAWWGGQLDSGSVGRDRYPHEVGLKKPNAWGLHDMHGNVWEWCRDWFTDELTGGQDPESHATGKYRVHRGGSWYSDSVECRSAHREWYSPDDCELGFRVACCFEE
jgi:sulfatase modifying factor 1